MRESGEERHLPLRPERQLAHQDVGAPGQGGREFRLRAAVGPRAERQVLPHGQVAIQAQALRHVPESAPVLAIRWAAQQLDAA